MRQYAQMMFQRAIDLAIKYDAQWTQPWDCGPLLSACCEMSGMPEWMVWQAFREEQCAANLRRAAESARGLYNHKGFKFLTVETAYTDRYGNAQTRTENLTVSTPLHRAVTWYLMNCSCITAISEADEKQQNALRLKRLADMLKTSVDRGEFSMYSAEFVALIVEWVDATGLPEPEPKPEPKPAKRARATK
jgi:hypothetical protein